jgi:hypothetical protein
MPWGVREKKALKPRVSQWFSKRFGSCRGKKDDINVPSRVEPAAMRLTSCDLLSVSRLLEARRLAIRRGVWFRALNRLERGVLELTVKCVDSIKSAKLAKVVTAILVKLKLAMESAVERTVKIVGHSLAEKISNIALSWGNRSASKWREDPSFARYLAITHMNTQRLFQV